MIQDFELRATLTQDQAHLLFLLLKRITFDGVLQCAQDKDECYAMIDVIELIQRECFDGWDRFRL
ncbi:DUF7706 family protein [Nitrogeniibacter aestuarii]|uniref:DUF7706 family protein n=1 Tax=Nitrogeniibacter aestuarii TaxID=2815343 RepID=UPI001D12E331|nr:hypothetical protein [Nitrogeniibacter aestuarii]